MLAMDKQNPKAVIPPKTWQKDNSHFIKAITSKWYRHIVELNNLISYYTALFYKQEGMKTLFLPITTNSISSPMGKGSDSSPVMVSLFDIDTYLVDSMQFLLEYGCRIFPEGCYYLMPSFRGEPADERHLCQFYHSEAEIVGGLGDVIALVERYIKYLTAHILRDYQAGIVECAGSIKHIEHLLDMKGAFPRITYREALKILGDDEKYYTILHQGEKVINSYGEKKLMTQFKGVLWLTHMESGTVPFYQAESPQDPGISETADLLCGIGETVGSGARHNNAEQTLNALIKHDVNPRDYKWYLDMKRKYPLQTAGFGMGIERYLLWILNHDDIRDCQLIPRFNGIKSQV